MLMRKEKDLLTLVFVGIFCVLCTLPFPTNEVIHTQCADLCIHHTVSTTVTSHTLKAVSLCTQNSFFLFVRGIKCPSKYSAAFLCLHVRTCSAFTVLCTLVVIVQFAFQITFHNESKVKKSFIVFTVRFSTLLYPMHHHTPPLPPLISFFLTTLYCISSLCIAWYDAFLHE